MDPQSKRSPAFALRFVSVMAVVHSMRRRTLFFLGVLLSSENTVSPVRGSVVKDSDKLSCRKLLPELAPVRCCQQSVAAALNMMLAFKKKVLC